MSTHVETPDLDLQESAATRGGPSLLVIAWQRKSLVILGILIGLVLGLLYYAQRQPLYQASALVLVVKKSDDPGRISIQGGDTRSEYMVDYMSTQQVLIKSPEIVKRAARVLGELKSFPGEKDEELLNSIRENLNVQRDTKDTAGAPNNILSVSFRGPVAEECPLVVRTVIDGYQNFLNEVYKNVSNTTFELIDKANNVLQKTYADDLQKYQEFRQKSPHLLFRTQQGILNTPADRMGLIEKERASVRLKQAATKTRLEDIQKTYKEKGKDAALQQIIATGVKIEQLSGSGELDRTLMTLRLKRLEYTGTLGYGSSHPAVQSIDTQIAFITENYGKGANAIANTDPAKKGQGAVPDADIVITYIKAMNAEIQDGTLLLKMYDGMYDTEQKSARELSEAAVDEEHFRDKIGISKDLLTSISKKLSEINLVRDIGGYDARTIAPANGYAKVAPKALQVFPIAAIAGLLAGLCLAYLAELSDKSFRTPAEIRRRLGLPVIGHIPFYVADEKAAKQQAAGEMVVDPMICTHYASNSLSSEAFRSVRTALYFNTQGVGHQVIQVTSPNVSDGKSTLAANLAVSIAQSGKRTILIDADCRRPRIHKIFGISANVGLANVIAGQADLLSAIQTTIVPNLSLLPCGPRPANPSELLTSPRFKELLDIIRAQFDFVIVDTPPLLVVTDPCVVAPRVDGVILAIRVTKNGRPFAERAKEILASLGANVLGVVVNGLGSQTGGRYGYGYDQYAYGYQYGYQYRYSYTYTDEYSDDKAASYYENAPGAAGSAPAIEEPSTPPTDPSA